MKQAFKCLAHRPWLSPHREPFIQRVRCTCALFLRGPMRGGGVASGAGRSRHHPAPDCVLVQLCTAPWCPHEQREPQRRRSPSWGEGSRDGEERGDPVQTANSQVHSLTGRAGSRRGWLVLDLYPEPPSPAPKQVDAEKPEFKPSDLMAQTKLKSRAENRPRLSFYSSSSLMARLSAGRPKGWGLESSGASFIHIPGSWWWPKLRS